MTFEEKLNDIEKLRISFGCLSFGHIKNVSIVNENIPAQKEKTAIMKIEWSEGSIASMMYSDFTFNNEIHKIILQHQCNNIYEAKGVIIQAESTFDKWVIITNKLVNCKREGYCEFCGERTVKKSLLVTTYDYCPTCKK